MTPPAVLSDPRPASPLLGSDGQTKGAGAPPMYLVRSASPRLTRDSVEVGGEPAKEAGADGAATAARALAAGSPPPPPSSSAETIARLRARHLGPNLTTFFADAPLEIRRARGCVLEATDGRRYLDCINNVSHVGHCHPHVVSELARQLGEVNTNSRYLSLATARYAERLQGTLPEHLSTVYFVCSGSEANELAYRVATAQAAARLADRDAASASPARARDVASRFHVAVLDHGYHGHTVTASSLSPYKFARSGGGGRPRRVHVLPLPDPLRREGLDGRAAAERVLAEVAAEGGVLGAFFAESFVSCGGQVDLAQGGWLADVFAVFQAAGAVCVADEVQCGFGRVGDSFWAFERAGVSPDAVTMGKSIGNGYPMGALVITRALAERFAAAAPEFFATNGGNNASSAAGAAVLDAIESERLQERARDVGDDVRRQLLELAAADPRVADVRGRGLMLGVELCHYGAPAGEGERGGPGAAPSAPARPGAADLPAGLRAHPPATALARFVVRWAKTHRGVLLSAEGPYESTIKIKPPLAFTREDGVAMVSAIRHALEASRECEGALAAESFGAVVAAYEAHRDLLA